MRIFFVFGLALLFATSAEAATSSKLFPQPIELEPAVTFWTRVYTEIDTGHGFIHDSRHLDVVYEVINLSTNSSRRTRDNAIKKTKNRYAKILRSLARGKRSHLGAEAQRILSLWPDKVSRKTLRDAASQLRFQQGQADKFRAGWIRSGTWMPHILQTLSERELPAELAVLPHVESSFNPKASSHAGAAGLWQFTRSTGRRFMRIDSVVDERRDPYMSTVAAAQLLKRNYAILEHWPLALTAYNHGVAGMRRAVLRLKTHDIETIIERYKSRTFGFASRNFYPAFLAALTVNRNAATHFGHLEQALPVDTMTVTVPEYLHVKTVETVLGIDRTTLQEYNPALRKSVWTGQKYVPRHFKLRIPIAHVNLGTPITLTNIPSDQRFVKQKRDRQHRVQRGDTLSGIATRYGIRIAELVSLNGINRKHLIYAGQRLILPATKVPRKHIKPATREPIPEDGEYTIRRGDSIYRIAHRFGIEERTLLALNPMRNRHKLKIGQVLRLNPARPDESDTLVVIAETLDENVLATAQVTLSADPSDYTVAPDETIEVQALETLGHYANWLHIRTQKLRNLNNMDFAEHVVSGARLTLDFSRVPEETFESRRLAYHQKLQENFFRQFHIRDTQTHTVQRGESIWLLSKRKYHVPVWLLRQYNPDLDLNHVSLGAQVNIPVLERVTNTTG